jgi:cell division septation protein DedD
VSPPTTAQEPAPGNGPQRLARAEPTGQPAAASPLRSGGLGGTYRLQLTAVRSETGLTAAWADLRQRYPRALAAVSPKVERTETGSGPLFRLQAGPFSSREAAANACGTIRSSGGQCFIVGPIGP